MVQWMKLPSLNTGLIKIMIKNDPCAIPVLGIFLLSSFYWSYTSIMRFYALNAHTFDLGVNVQFAWVFMHDPISYYGIVFKPIVWIIFPIFLPHNDPLILAFQSVFITLAMIPLYGIAKHLLKHNVAAFFISLSYTLFPLIAGMYWFDFHYQVLFPTLFLSGYYFYLKKSYKPSLILFVLSAIVRFPYILLMCIFSIILLFDVIKKSKRENLRDTKEFRFIITLFLILWIYLGFIFLKYYSANPASLTQSFTANAYLPTTQIQQSPLFNIDNKVFTLTIIFLAFLGLPLLSPRFLMLTLPYIYLLIFANFPHYYFPLVFQYQYGGMIIPFLYLGTLDALSKFPTPGNKPAKNKARLYFKDIKTRISITIVLIMILFSLVYQPFGPFNTKYTGAYFDASQNLNVNWVRFNALEKVIAMIPFSNPNFVVQENLPQIFPRPLLDGSVQTTSVIAPNVTPPYLYLIPVHKNVRIDYALFDFAPNPTNSFDAVLVPAGINQAATPYEIASIFYQSGEYGILAYADGIVLLELNYTGPIKYYTPYEQLYPATMFDLGYAVSNTASLPNERIVQNQIVVSNITTFSVIWFGPYTYLGPGKYNVTFELMTTNTSSQNTALLGIHADYGQVFYGSTDVNGSLFKAPDKWTNFTITVTLDNFQDLIEFYAYSGHWIGSLSLEGVYVEEIAPPNSTI